MDDDAGTFRQLHQPSTSSSGQLSSAVQGGCSSNGLRTAADCLIATSFSRLCEESEASCRRDPQRLTGTGDWADAGVDDEQCYEDAGAAALGQWWRNSEGMGKGGGALWLPPWKSVEASLEARWHFLSSLPPVIVAALEAAKSVSDSQVRHRPIIGRFLIPPAAPTAASLLSESSSRPHSQRRPTPFIWVAIGPTVYIWAYTSSSSDSAADDATASHSPRGAPMIDSSFPRSPPHSARQNFSAAHQYSHHSHLRATPSGTGASAFRRSSIPPAEPPSAASRTQRQSFANRRSDLSSSDVATLTFPRPIIGIEVVEPRQEVFDDNTILRLLAVATTESISLCGVARRIPRTTGRNDSTSAVRGSMYRRTRRATSGGAGDPYHVSAATPRRTSAFAAGEEGSLSTTRQPFDSHTANRGVAETSNIATAGSGRQLPHVVGGATPYHGADVMRSGGGGWLDHEHLRDQSRSMMMMTAASGRGGQLSGGGGSSGYRLSEEAHRDEKQQQPMMAEDTVEFFHLEDFKVALPSGKKVTAIIPALSRHILFTLSDDPSIYEFRYSARDGLLHSKCRAVSLPVATGSAAAAPPEDNDNSSTSSSSLTSPPSLSSLPMSLLRSTLALFKRPANSPILGIKACKSHHFYTFDTSGAITLYEVRSSTGSTLRRHSSARSLADGAADVALGILRNRRAAAQAQGGSGVNSMMATSGDVFEQSTSGGGGRRLRPSNVQGADGDADEFLGSDRVPIDDYDEDSSSRRKRHRGSAAATGDDSGADEAMPGRQRGGSSRRTSTDDFIERFVRRAAVRDAKASSDSLSDLRHIGRLTAAEMLLMAKVFLKRGNADSEVRAALENVQTSFTILDIFPGQTLRGSQILTVVTTCGIQLTFFCSIPETDLPKLVGFPHLKVGDEHHLGPEYTGLQSSTAAPAADDNTVRPPDGSSAECGNSERHSHRTVCGFWLTDVSPLFMPLDFAAPCSQAPRSTQPPDGSTGNAVEHPSPFTVSSRLRRQHQQQQQQRALAAARTSLLQPPPTTTSVTSAESSHIHANRSSELLAPTFHGCRSSTTNCYSSILRLPGLTLSSLTLSMSSADLRRAPPLRLLHGSRLGGGSAAYSFAATSAPTRPAHDEGHQYNPEQDSAHGAVFLPSLGSHASSAAPHVLKVAIHPSVAPVNTLADVVGSNTGQVPYAAEQSPSGALSHASLLRSASLRAETAVWTPTSGRGVSAPEIWNPRIHDGQLWLKSSTYIQCIAMEEPAMAGSLANSFLHDDEEEEYEGAQGGCNGRGNHDLASCEGSPLFWGSSRRVLCLSGWGELLVLELRWRGLENAAPSVWANSMALLRHRRPLDCPTRRLTANRSTSPTNSTRTAAARSRTFIPMVHPGGGIPYGEETARSIEDIFARVDGASKSSASGTTVRITIPMHGFSSHKAPWTEALASSLVAILMPNGVLGTPLLKLSGGSASAGASDLHATRRSFFSPAFPGDSSSPHSNKEITSAADSGCQPHEATTMMRRGECIRVAWPIALIHRLENQLLDVLDMLSNSPSKVCIGPIYFESARPWEDCHLLIADARRAADPSGDADENMTPPSRNFDDMRSPLPQSPSLSASHRAAHYQFPRKASNDLLPPRVPSSEEEVVEWNRDALRNLTVAASLVRQILTLLRRFIELSEDPSLQLSSHHVIESNQLDTWLPLLLSVPLSDYLRPGDFSISDIALEGLTAFAATLLSEIYRLDGPRAAKEAEFLFESVPWILSPAEPSLPPYLAPKNMMDDIDDIDAAVEEPAPLTDVFSKVLSMLTHQNSQGSEAADMSILRKLVSDASLKPDGTLRPLAAAALQDVANLTLNLIDAEQRELAEGSSPFPLTKGETRTSSQSAERAFLFSLEPYFEDRVTRLSLMAELWRIFEALIRASRIPPDQPPKLAPLNAAHQRRPLKVPAGEITEPRRLLLADSQAETFSGAVITVDGDNGDVAEIARTSSPALSEDEELQLAAARVRVTATGSGAHRLWWSTLNFLFRDHEDCVDLNLLPGRGALLAITEVQRSYFEYTCPKYAMMKRCHSDEEDAMWSRTLHETTGIDMPFDCFWEIEGFFSESRFVQHYLRHFASQHSFSAIRMRTLGEVYLAADNLIEAGSVFLGLAAHGLPRAPPPPADSQQHHRAALSELAEAESLQLTDFRSLLFLAAQNCVLAFPGDATVGGTVATEEAIMAENVRRLRKFNPETLCRIFPQYLGATIGQQLSLKELLTKVLVSIDAELVVLKKRRTYSEEHLVGGSPAALFR